MSNKAIVFGAVVAAAVFAGVYFVAREPQSAPAASVAAAPGAAQPAVAAPSAPMVPQGSGLKRVEAAARPTPTDPRIAALMGPPGRDALVEYLAGADGRVIQEIDRDANSRGYGRPLREYLYSGDKIVGVTNYRYLGDQVQIVRTMVAYKPDGSVDQIRDSTAYEAEARARN